jgi:hypothetical protein
MELLLTYPIAARRRAQEELTHFTWYEITRVEFWTSVTLNPGEYAGFAFERWRDTPKVWDISTKDNGWRDAHGAAVANAILWENLDE